MTSNDIIEGHYTPGGLIEAIEAGLQTMGKSPETVTVDDLSPVDEFHIGGREATAAFLGDIGLKAGDRVFEIGCGLGGTSRFIADRFGSRVSGIDLTAEFVEAARTLSSWVGLAEKLEFQCGDATHTPFDASAFDAAFMLHVGMNIADKKRLFAEVARIIRRDGIFGIYDIMKTTEGEIPYPMPWASSAETSAIAKPDDYKSALEETGFKVEAERNRADFAMDYYRRLQARAARDVTPAPLGLHLVMGLETSTKVANMFKSVEDGLIAPVEIIARRT